MIFLLYSAMAFEHSNHNLLLPVLFTAAITLFSAANACNDIGNHIFSTETRQESKKRREAEVAQLPLMQNLYHFREGPQVPLPYRDRFGAIMKDPNRNYCRKLTHMFSWEILDLAYILKAEIESGRQSKWRPEVKNPGKKRAGRPPKYNHINRLLFVLEWLSSGDDLNKSEYEYKYSKTSLDEDRIHILRAINKCLANEICWPTAQEREILKAAFTGILTDVVGILDVTEWEISKPKNSDHERETFSGKAKTNTKKTLAVIDKHGYFIFVDILVNGRRNDRDQFTSCDLYMLAGNYFSQSERLASDGGFRGDGPLLISYDNLDTPEKILFNLAFKEVRVGVENAFGRIQNWFPILGRNKRYWHYDEDLLELAVGAATKLHNWMLRNRGLQYEAQANPRNHYRDLY